MFQNRRRRYSHEGRHGTVRRRPLPDIGAVQDPGVAKSTCCWMIGHPETERIDPYDKDVERV